MKRLLSGVLLAAAAFATVPASAAPPDVVTVENDSDGTGVHTAIPGQPLVSVRYSKVTGQLCVTVSKQVPQCLGRPR